MVLFMRIQCHPFLNILIENINEKQHIKLLLLCSFMYIIIGTIPGFGATMNYVSWFIVLYFIGAYIRLYERQVFSATRFWGWATLFFFLVSIASVIGMTGIKTLLEKNDIGYWFVSDSNKILAVLLALSAFMFFKNIRMKNNKFVNTIAASAFGVLMIHANSDTMRQWLWKDVFHNVEMYNSDLLIVHVVGSVLGVYIICTVIDNMRVRFFERPLFVLWDKYWENIRKMYTAAEERICKKLNIKD